MKSRWCQVIAERFDYVVGPTRMVSGRKGDILFLPERIAAAGASSGSLKRIPKPKGYRVDKSGRVICS